MRVHVIQTSFAELDQYWKERDKVEQDNRLARAGDRVRLKTDVRTAASRGRPPRTVPPGSTGIVLTNSGSILRVQFSDADVMDEAFVSAYDVTLVTEPDE